MRDNGRECGCLRCWNRNHPGDPNWPVLPPGDHSQGTVEAQVPCQMIIEIEVGRRIVVASACRFFGHTVAEARGKAIRHLRAGVEACQLAQSHSPQVHWPPLEGHPSARETA